MLEKRIAEAEGNVRSYLREGMLKKSNDIDKNILNVFRKNSEESLLVASHIFKNNLSSLWVVVCSYYSMYYVANAVLHSIRYKVGHKISHKVTSDALIVFVRNRLKERLLEDYEDAKNETTLLARLDADKVIESFDFERVKRSTFQYDMTESIKKSKAETSLERAKSFAYEMEKLLGGCTKK